jgi:hypothetical protein
MVTSLSALEPAARTGDVLPAIEVLLDELESIAALGSGDRVDRVRAHILRLARVRGSIWAQQPELTLVDFYARTLELPELDGVRRRWIAMLDARGPWLRALRPSSSDASVLAELAFDQPTGLRFEGEHEVVLAGDDEELYAWSWTHAQLERRADLEPFTPLDQDSRFAHDYDGRLCYRAAPNAEPRPLPWPGFDHAHAKLSADGRTIFVYGWYDAYVGLVQLVDPHTLVIRRTHEFERPVREVCERAGSDELLVATSEDLMIVGPDGPRWTRKCAAQRFAWSPSGRYVCKVERGVARIVDTRADVRPAARGGGLPLGFSPDGARLVDREALLDGRTGARIAKLDLQLGSYLEGGPAFPWSHVGTELIVCMHGGLALWDTRTGERVTPGAAMHVPYWERIAYSRSGRWFAHGRSSSLVTIGSLPSTATIAEFEFEADFDIERLALSSTAEFVAAYGAGQIEVRDRSGARICMGRTPEPRAPEQHPHPAGSFEFLADDRRLRLHEPAISGWSSGRGEYARPGMTYVWDLETNPATVLGSDAGAAPAPAGWTIESGPVSIFTHQSGARIVVPSEGPWLASPLDPRILACPGGLFELREGPRS